MPERNTFRSAGPLPSRVVQKLSGSANILLSGSCFESRLLSATVEQNKTRFWGWGKRYGNKNLERFWRAAGMKQKVGEANSLPGYAQSAIKRRRALYFLPARSKQALQTSRLQRDDSMAHSQDAPSLVPGFKYNTESSARSDQLFSGHEGAAGPKLSWFLADSTERVGGGTVR